MAAIAFVRTWPINHDHQYEHFIKDFCGVRNVEQ
jgi:hypothetical protein